MLTQRESETAIKAPPKTSQVELIFERNNTMRVCGVGAPNELGHAKQIEEFLIAQPLATPDDFTRVCRLESLAGPGVRIHVRSRRSANARHHQSAPSAV